MADLISSPGASRFKYDALSELCQTVSTGAAPLPSPTAPRTGELLTQGEILCRERCSGDDQTPDEQKERGDEDHKCEANYRKKDEPDDRAEWLMISLTASSSMRDGIFGSDNGRSSNLRKT
jgi:hypothetical protein